MRSNEPSTTSDGDAELLGRPVLQGGIREKFAMRLEIELNLREFTGSNGYLAKADDAS